MQQERSSSFYVLACIIAVALAIAVPNYRAAHRHDGDFRRASTCRVRLQMLSAAIEMRDRDNDIKTTSIDDALFTALEQEGYVKDGPTADDRDLCPRSNYALTKDGRIYCKQHGTMDGSPPPF